MRSIQRRFLIEQDKNPLLSSLMNFSSAVRGQRFNKRSISDWFDKLVDKEDYDRKDKQDIIDFLESLTLKKEG